MLQITYWSLPSLAAMTLSALVWRSMPHRHGVPGAASLGALCACVILWSLGQFLGSLTTDLHLKVLASKLQYPAIALLPVTWLTFSLSYARQWSALGKPLLVALLVLPAVTVALAWSNELHHWLWTDVALHQTAGFVGLAIDYGPWFQVYSLFAYALIGAGTVILVYELSSSARHRRALVAVILAPLSVAALNIVHLNEWNPLPFIDPTPLGFAIGSILLYRGVLHSGLLKLSPVLHRQVIEQLDDGVLVLDGEGRIVDANRAAQNILLPRGGSVIGLPIDELVPSNELRVLRDSSTHSIETTLHGRSHHVRASRLQTAPGEATAIVFRDISERLEAEHALQRATREMERLAYTDPLTGLPNRRAFMQRLQEECNRVHRHGGDLSVILLDLDRFKNVNDTYGHDAGDRILESVAGRIKANSRACDLAARLGGEEFALLLPGSTLDEARHVAERLRATIADYDSSSGNNLPCRVTASLGIAHAGNAAPDWRDLLKRGDLALYQAKDSGRNRVCG